MTKTAQEIVSFWHEAGPKKWYAKSDAFDQSLRDSFLDETIAARDGKLDDWIENAQSSLALILLLDQFPRNIFRDSPDMFASDPHAREIATRALERGHDAAIEGDLKQFMYMPFMHSEVLADQEKCIALFEREGREENLKHAHVHADIIRKFGRFPHRNALLGRTSTPEEIAFLESGGFAG